MHALLELFPLVGLVGGFLIGKSVNPDAAMYYLSYGAIIGTCLQFAIYKVRGETMQKTTRITGWVLIGFAAITIILQNDLFIMLKPTILSWAFAAFFWGYAWWKKKSVLELMMGEQFQLPAANWLTLNWAWVIFNFIIGLANLIVVWQIQQGAWNDDTWVSFKVALLPISLVFIAGQTVYLLKHGNAKDAEKPENNEKNSHKEM